MIYATFTPLPNGRVLSHLFIELKIPVSKSAIHVSQKDAEEQMRKWLSRWIREHLIHYCNQREHAYDQVKLGSVVAPSIQIIRKHIIPHIQLKALLTAIDQHQGSLRVLYPGKDSPQYSWAHSIEKLIHYAHQAIYPQYHRPVSGSAQSPESAGTHVAS